MRSSVQPVNSSRSLALKQYDEAKTLGTGVFAGTCSSTGAASRITAASDLPRKVPVQQDCSDDSGLCGWQEGPSVPPEARVASAKLSKHQPALPPAQQPPSTSHNSNNSSDRNSSGGSRRATPPGKGSSPSRRPAQGSPAPRSRASHQQQQQPTSGQLQLAGLVPATADDASSENCRTPDGVNIAPGATPTAAGTPAEAEAGAAAGACDSSSESSSRATSAGSNNSGISNSTKGASSSSSTWHLPSIQHSQLAASNPSSTAHADQACLIGSAAASGFEQPAADAANWDECGEAPDDVLFSPNGTGSRGAVGWQMPSTTLSSSNSNILALQQRLLLPACGSSLARTSSSGSGGLLAASRQSAAGITAQPAAGPHISASGSMGILMRGVGPNALQAAPAAPGFCLHTRMATTAARAQLLLTRDLNTMLAPHAPRVRPSSGQGVASSSTSAAVADDSREQQPWEEQPSLQQPQLSAAVDAVPTLRFVSSSRPSSASRGGRSAVAVAAAAAATTTTYPAAPALNVPVFSGPGLHTAAAPAAGSDCTLYSPQARTASTSSTCSSGGSGSSGSVVASRPASGLRRPVSASVGGAVRWGSGSGSDSGLGTGSSRPSSSGVPLLGVSNAGTGSAAGTPQSKGLSAAADYMACRATVGELLQRINSQKAAASASVQQLARTVSMPPKAASPGATRAVTPAAAVAGLAGHDTAFSRDSRLASSMQTSSRTPMAKGVPSSQLLGVHTQPGPSGVERCTSLKAYQAFQSGPVGAPGSVSTVGGGVGSNVSNGASWPCLYKSISSGPSIRTGASTATLELRASAALRKCGSNKQ